MKGLDLSKFKKIAQDKTSAKLMHPDGHSITIAVGGLSPDMRKKLAALPLHQADAEDQVEAPDFEDPALDADREPAATEAPTAPQAQAPAAPQQAAPPAQAPSPEQAAPAAAPQSPTEQQPASQPAQDTAQPAAAPSAPPPMTPAQEAQQMLHDQLQIGDDIKNGHIAPKTSQDLFAKNADGTDRGTLGKLGLMFGMLAGGIGSGLTHQPNALMAMMDKQIMNDLDAQKTMQTNKQNWYNAFLNQGKAESENTLRGAQTQEAYERAAKAHWENAKYGIYDANAYAGMQIAKLDQFQHIVDKTPPGPVHDQLQNMLTNSLVPDAFNRVNKMNFTATTKKAAGQAASAMAGNLPPQKGYADPSKQYASVDQNKVNQLAIAGSALGKTVPGISLSEGDAKNINENIVPAVDQERELKRQYVNDWNTLNLMKHKGQIPGLKAMDLISGLAGGLLGAGAAAASGGGGPLTMGMSSIVGSLEAPKAGELASDYLERARKQIIEKWSPMIANVKKGGMTAAESKGWLNEHFPVHYDTAATNQTAFKNSMDFFEQSKAEQDFRGVKAHGIYTEPPKYEYKAPPPPRAIPYKEANTVKEHLSTNPSMNPVDIYINGEKEQ